MKILYLTLLCLTLKTSLTASDFGLILPRYLTGDSLFVHLVPIHENECLMGFI